MTKRPHPKNPTERRVYAKGFSLVEMLVVCAVIGGLAVLALPVLGRMLEGGRQARCVANLKQLYMAHIAYANEHGGRIPLGYVPRGDDGTVARYWSYIDAGADFQQYLGGGTVARTDGSKLPAHTGFREPYLCPADDGSQQMTKGYSYGLNAHLAYIGKVRPDGGHDQARMALWAHPSKTFLLADANRSFIYANVNGMNYAMRHNGGCNVIFLDGHVEKLTTFPSHSNRAKNPFWNAYALE